MQCFLTFVLFSVQTHVHLGLLDILVFLAWKWVAELFYANLKHDVLKYCIVMFLLFSVCFQGHKGVKGEAGEPGKQGHKVKCLF